MSTDPTRTLSRPSAIRQATWIVPTLGGLGAILLLEFRHVLSPDLAVPAAGLVVGLGAVAAFRMQRGQERGMLARLALSEERFRRTIESAPIGLAVVGLDGRWLDVNAAICRLVGYDRETLLRMTFQDITHPDDLATDLGLLQRTIRGEIPGYVMEKRYRHRDGREVPVELHVSLVRDLQGAPTHFVSQIVDLTQRVASERALLNQEAAFAALIEESDDVVVRYDLEGRIVYANPATARGSGHSVESLVGKRVDEVPGIDQDLAERWNKVLTRVMRTGRGEKLEYGFPHPDGSFREWQARFTPDRGPDGRIVGAFATSRDITDLQADTEAVSRRSEEFATIAENAADMIVRYDLAGRYRYANPAALRLLKRTIDEVVGRRPSDLMSLPADVVQQWDERNATAIREGRTVKVRTVTIDGGGRAHTFESSATPEYNALGRAISVLVISREVGESREA